MAPIKRKGNAPNNSSAAHPPKKRARVSDSGPKKDLKKESKSTKDEQSAGSKDALKPEKKAPEASILREDEPSFPRGGGDVLTPLERKQIQNQATRDVLFEQKKTGKPVDGYDDDDDDDDDDKDGDVGSKDADEPEGAIKKPRKGRNKDKKRPVEKAAPAKDTVRIEGLSFKRVALGSVILGRVSSINPHDIGLALPNNLTGYVPIAAISKKVDERIEKLLNDDQSEDEAESEAGDDDDMDLKSYFHLGQYLRATVTATESDTNGKFTKTKKHIQLSVDPRKVNPGLTKSDLVLNSTVQASVLSVEDHGLVMDLGLQDADVKGFMSSREIDPSLEYSKIQEGAVFLCMVTGHNASGNVVKLSANLHNSGSTKKSHFLTSAPTINSFLPGTAAEILLTDVTPTGMAGKIMGMLDTTADLVHSGANSGKDDLTKKYHPGAKVKGRLICTFPTAEPSKIAFSLLDHVLKFSQTTLSDRGTGNADSDVPALSSIIDEAKIVKVEPGLGVYAEFGSKKHLGFVHISRLSDAKVDSISSVSGPYRLETTHKARIVGYNALDNLFLLSFEKTILDQPFLRLEDLVVGAVVKGKVEKLLIGVGGVDGLIVSLADKISGLVPGMHMADTQLQFPEKKFREGMAVSARILSVNLEKRQVRLTLKKSLLNSESAIWKDYTSITPGSQSPGTLVNIQQHGAVVQFYGSIRGFLPVSEMSEAYIKDPSQHFRLGQVVNVHALSVDAEVGKLAVSCKDPSTFTDRYKQAFDKVLPGTLVTGTVFEKSNADLLLKLEDSGLVARLDAAHLTDKSSAKSSSVLSKIRVGQKLQDLLILDIKKTHRLIRVTNKKTLKKAYTDGKLPGKLEELTEGAVVTGYIKNITSDGVFVEFIGGLTGLLPKRLIEDSNVGQPDFGMALSQPISATIFSIDYDTQRFFLSMKPIEAEHTDTRKRAKADDSSAIAIVNPVDKNIHSVEDLSFGKLTDAKIISVKETQINVKLSDNIQGRVDVSEIFDSWEDIKDRKQPLRFFNTKQVISVRVLGIHDARSHKFLPISHRSGKYPVFELSIKPSFLSSENPDPLTLQKVQVGSSWLGFINNIADDCVWVNISPNVRGRVRAIDLSDDVSLLADMPKHFPIGSALRVTVTGVDIEKNRLDFSAKRGGPSVQLTLEDLSQGMILPGRVTKVTERQVLLQLSKFAVGAVSLIDMADDYSEVNPASYNKNDMIRSCVVGIDIPNKKVMLSLRPSKVLSSSLPVKDPEITSANQLKVNQFVRGFVRRVADNGLFVTLGHDVTAYVRISDLSDSYLKEWKDNFQVDQLVRGRVTVLDLEKNRIQLSMKESVLDPEYKVPITLKDLQLGQIITGRIRKVEDFGAFIVVDGSANVSGLCHRSQMAEKRVEDARKLFEEGDIVKAKILNIEPEKERVSFGLKASYFGDVEEDESDSQDEDSADDMSGVELELNGAGNEDSDDNDDDDLSMGGVELAEGSDSDEEEDDDNDVQMAGSEEKNRSGGLVTGGFNWSGNADDVDGKNDVNSDSDGDQKVTKKKKRRKADIKVDRTGDLDAQGPQSVADFERLLLGEPDSSLLWLKYMAFQLELSEVEKTREIAKRALRTINIGQDTEKLNIWVAWLNLENTYGNDDSLEEVFKDACQYNDAEEIHERMISIYIQSGKNDKADSLFQATLKKKFSQSPDLYLNFATFLFNTLAAPERGRALLPRAIQSLPSHMHVNLTSKFGQLEFRSPNGDVERGRTVFEGLLSSFPKKIDLWNVLLDLEISVGDAEQVRRLFERVLGLGKKGGNAAAANMADGSAKRKLKPKQAKFFFKKWLSFEEKAAEKEGGNVKMVDEVKARAAEYVKSQQVDE